MINNILFICTGNICRSPMAEGLLKHRSPEKTVYSAGINALIGAPADRLSVQVMWEQGIDIGAHRARHLGAWMVSGADLILTMDQDQKRFIELNYLASKNKVFRLGEFGNYDVPDPFHQGLAAFRQSRDLIAQGVDAWSRALHTLVKNEIEMTQRPFGIQTEPSAAGGANLT